MFELIQGWLISQGIDSSLTDILTRSVLVVLVVILGFLTNFIAKRYILSGISHLIDRTKTRWDDALLQRKVFKKLAHLAPALVIYVLIPIALQGMDSWIGTVKSAVLIYVIVMVVLVIDSLLNAVLDIYRGFEISKRIHIRSFIQVVKIALYFVSGIFIISIVLDKTPFYFLSGLGALTAVLMLIFKDAILGFVAGIQLTANNMVAQGDWIAMPKYGADGDVLEVTLTTVKVQNWDKTITTIPTYALISESFKNWRGMQESGGRRIKRSINVDINTIKFCTEDMLKRFSKIQFIKNYIAKKEKELAEYNATVPDNDSSQVNRRRLTNIGTFRAYVQAYLKNHPMINQNMTFLIRQLAPSEHGLPIEIYVFSNDIRWANYEAIQADIFDHILAAVPEFDLRVFQNPTGGDFREIWKEGADNKLSRLQTKAR